MSLAAPLFHLFFGPREAMERSEEGRRDAVYEGEKKKKKKKPRDVRNIPYARPKKKTQKTQRYGGGGRKKAVASKRKT